MDPQAPNNPPAAARMYSVVVVVPERPDLGPAVVTLQRSAIKVARKLMGKLKISQAPTYGLTMVMSSIKDRNSQGQEFFNFAWTMAGLVTDEGSFKEYEALYQRFKAEGLRIRDIEGLQDEGVGGDDPAPAGVNIEKPVPF